ncbi:tRNA (guanine(9)-N(1))-methyltransferase [Teratosphaeriaceae sp. CCFEE 6253]|nr:tRNA (guanine(9)-N(1))-methyltransferase [Teratosphaeriaceae sp. CCFEE 6253]
MDEDERPTKLRKMSHDDRDKTALDARDVDPEFERGVPANGDVHQYCDVPEIIPQAAKTEPGLEAGGLPSDDLEMKTDSNVFNALPPPSIFAPLSTTDEVVTDGPAMSKNQSKKLQKRLDWESKRGERKLMRKEKLVAKRERKREARVDQADGEALPDAPPAPPPRKPAFRRAVQLPISILVDCDFDDLMRDNERISLASQITRCYSDNKNAFFRAHLAVCSFGGDLRKRFDNVLDHYKGWRGVRFLDEDFLNTAEQAKVWMADEGAGSGGELKGSFSTYSDSDLAQLREQGEVVYLSSEASETLTKLKPYSTYIIGGLVDKNREKGICYKRATRAGIRTARLPIGDYMEMSSRKVLATNHVNEIMLEWLRCGDWGEAFMKVIPKRKGGQLKGQERPEEVLDVPGQDADDGDPDEEDGGVATSEVAEVADARPGAAA